MARGGCVRVGGTVWNSLKGGGTEKRKGEAKILKSGGQAGLRCGCLKKRGTGTPLPTTLILVYVTSINGVCKKWSIFRHYHTLRSTTVQIETTPPPHWTSKFQFIKFLLIFWVYGRTHMSVFIHLLPPFHVFASVRNFSLIFPNSHPLFVRVSQIDDLPILSSNSPSAPCLLAAYSYKKQ